MDGHSKDYSVLVDRTGAAEVAPLYDCAQGTMWSSPSRACGLVQEAMESVCGCLPERSTSIRKLRRIPTDREAMGSIAKAT